MGLHGISKSTLSRLPVYLEYLKSLPDGSPPNISATIIASALGLGEVQVRKDLASVSTAGKPKIGYIIRDLVSELESFLGYDNLNSALIVGVGKLGRALLEYDGFARYGIEIIAGFDQNVADDQGGKPIYPMSRLSAFCREHAVKIGVIAVPAAAAQQVCDQMIKSGILAILNFAPTRRNRLSSSLCLKCRTGVRNYEQYSGGTHAAVSACGPALFNQPKRRAVFRHADQP